MHEAFGSNASTIQARLVVHACDPGISRKEFTVTCCYTKFEANLVNKSRLKQNACVYTPVNLALENGSTNIRNARPASAK